MNADQGKILFSAAQVAEAASGQVVWGDPSLSVTGVGTDTRQPMPEQLFIALKGENFDGARFCQAAVQAGARVLLVCKSSFDDGLCGQLDSTVALVTVDDTLTALGDLAGWHRDRHSARVVAITGSNGKTSTKEMTAAVLGGAPDVHFNRGNFNNLVGMPRALLGLTEAHSHAVMEMGMNAPGEIARLAQVARPQIGLITNVHPVHLEGLGSLQAVAQAKGELVTGLPGDGVAVLNADDPMVLGLAEQTKARVVTFGHSPAANVQLGQIETGAAGLKFELNVFGERMAVVLDRLGSHNALNAAAAAVVGHLEGIELPDIARRLAGAPAPPMRMEILDLGDFKLLVDCYNANPRSVQAGLNTLAELPSGGPRLAVLGDMLELGDSAEQLHRQVGRSAHEAGLDGLCAFGHLAEAMVDAAREAGLRDVLATEDVLEAMAWVRARLVPGAWLLLKGSRGMRLERIAAELANEHGVEWGLEH